jgi:hypothetical protein
MRKRIYIRKNGEQIIKYYDYKLYDHLYYEKNKDKKLQKVKCTCGLDICKIVLNRHKRTVKHVFAMIKINLNSIFQ